LLKSITEQIIEKIYREVKQPQDEMVDNRDFKNRFAKMGILPDDPRVIVIFERLEEMPQKLTKEMLAEVVEEHEGIVEKVLAEDFIMSDFEGFK